MRRIGFVLLFSLPAMAAVSGIVVNHTTGKVQPGATVALNKLGQNGIELIDQAKSDAEGKFTINQEVQGPHVIRTAFDGVTYNHMLPPGVPTTDLRIDVYSASKQPGGAKLSKHMILFQPSGGQMVINETYMYANTGLTAWNDPEGGTLHFFLPAEANGKVQVNATAPGGMPIPAPVSAAGRAGIYKVDFPIKPGDTRFDLAYTVPHADGAPYQGQVAAKADDTYLIAPDGVTLAGAGLSDLGQEPRSKAHIFGLKGTSYKIELTGAVAAPAAENSEAAGEQDSGPPVEQIMPRLNGKAPLIAGLALGILALGFVLLYRAPAAAPAGPAAAKGGNERGRR